MNNNKESSIWECTGQDTDTLDKQPEKVIRLTAAVPDTQSTETQSTAPTYPAASYPAASTPPSPRLLSRPEAAAYCRVTVETFDGYRRRGIVPGPIEGTDRWDRKLIDQYLDKASGISSAAGSSLDGWRAKRHG